MTACEWCYGVAEWRAETERGPRDVCQRHYDEISAERRSAVMSSPALARFVSA